MPPKAKAKAKAKTRRVLAIDKCAQVPRDMQVVARLLDDLDLVKRTQKALDERHARDDRIDYMPAGGEEVKALTKTVEGMKEQLKGMGSTVRSDSPRRSRSPRRFPMFEPRSGPSTMSRTMDRFRAPSLDTSAGMAAKRAVFRDARAASARAALRGRRLT